MFCLSCQALVMKGGTCDRCGQSLPGYTDPPPVPSKAARWRYQVLLLQSGDLARVDFEAALEGQHRQCGVLLAQTREENFDPEARAEMLEELTTGRRGLLTYQQALESLQAWLLSRDDEDLKRGLALAEQADMLVEQAIALNFQTHRTHLETTREFLQQMGYPGD